MAVAHVLIESYSIGKSDDELGRMLEVLRFWFTKDLVHLTPTCHPLPPEIRAECWTEIHQGKTMQAIQLDVG